MNVGECRKSTKTMRSISDKFRFITRLCSHYPEYLIIPMSIKDDQVKSAYKFRMSGRGPALVWRHQINGTVLVRSSQPQTGFFGWINGDDVALMREYVTAAKATPTHSQLLLSQRRDKASLLSASASLSTAPAQTTTTTATIAKSTTPRASDNKTMNGGDISDTSNGICNNNNNDNNNPRSTNGQQLTERQNGGDDCTDGMKETGCGSNGEENVEDRMKEDMIKSAINGVTTSTPSSVSSSTSTNMRTSEEAGTTKLQQNGGSTTAPLTSTTARSLLVLDARSYAAAWANRAKGGGYENQDCYDSCEIQFLSLPNIHAVRNSFQQLRQILSSNQYYNNNTDQTTFFAQLQQSNWLLNLSCLLESGARAARAMHVEGCSVLIHCSDGWDRTAQLTSLTQIILDPYTRTLKGFRELIEREWIEFGHKFADRCGTMKGDNNEQSPIFLQFLDALHQLHKQFPDAFQFNHSYIIKLAEHVYSGLFGTFLCNSGGERRVETVDKRTLSIWSYLSNPEFENSFYQPPDPMDEEKWSIWPKTLQKDLEIWNDLYSAAGSTSGNQHRNNQQLQSSNSNANSRPKSSSTQGSLNGSLHRAVSCDNMNSVGSGGANGESGDVGESNGVAIAISPQQQQQQQQQQYNPSNGSINNNNTVSSSPTTSSPTSTAAGNNGLIRTSSDSNLQQHHMSSSNNHLIHQQHQSPTAAGGVGEGMPRMVTPNGASLAGKPGNVGFHPGGGSGTDSCDNGGVGMKIGDSATKNPERTVNSLLNEALLDDISTNNGLLGGGRRRSSSPTAAAAAAAGLRLSEEGEDVMDSCGNAMADMAIDAMSMNDSHFLDDDEDDDTERRDEFAAATATGTNGHGGGKHASSIDDSIWNPLTPGDAVSTSTSEISDSLVRRDDASGSVGGLFGGGGRRHPPGVPGHLEKYLRRRNVPMDWIDPDGLITFIDPPQEQAKRKDYENKLKCERYEAQIKRLQRLYQQEQEQKNRLLLSLNSNKNKDGSAASHPKLSSIAASSSSSFSAQKNHLFTPNNIHHSVMESNIGGEPYSWEAIDEEDTEPTKWVPDHAVTNCMGCDQVFWAINRRHHCRGCGKIFCWQCSDYSSPVPHEQLYDPVRVCHTCYTMLSEQADKLPQHQSKPQHNGGLTPRRYNQNFNNHLVSTKSS